MDVCESSEGSTVYPVLKTFLMMEPFLFLLYLELTHLE